MNDLTLTNYTDLIEKFILVQDISRSSKKTYRLSLIQFFNWVSTSKILDISRKEILEYKDFLEMKGLRPATRSSYIVAVRRFFEWAESIKAYPNVAKGIKGSKKLGNFHQRNALTMDQIKKLLNAFDRDTLEGVRDFAIVNLLIRTGLRLIEIVRSDIADISKDYDEITLWIQGKGKDGKDEFVVLTKDTLDPIQNYLKLRKSKSIKEPLFASVSNRNKGQRLTVFSISRAIKNYMIKCGIKHKRISAHSLRHTFGVLSIQAGASLYEVQLAMRHSAPATTEIYLKDIERIKRLEASPEKKLSSILSNLL